MKKIVFIAAAAGLMSLAACGQGTPEEQAGDAMADNLEMQADNMEMMADNATTEAGEMMYDNAADNLEMMADNADDIGEMDGNMAMENAM
ncbi:hypothetical protein [Sphingomonas japonica]|uniref:Small lipoprotein YifL n=1 Tax=Sphingomonas japonica TaxID=511662 RepID=A0ABX0U8P7_9SPHN|nr:hypothetical protein [Sphingomonas japonica]NIJ25143.1 putative small lipoprotein YifL [Sphingomonas japonica]